MNTKQFEYAIVLGKEGSFSKAAEKLGITQPSLSQYIKKLEKDVGAELFKRSGQNVKPTNAGLVFLQNAARINRLQREMLIQISELQGGFKGSIKVGISPFRCAGMMPKVLLEFSKKYPEIKVILYEKTVSELVDNMTKEEYDICILPEKLDNPAFECVEITEENFYLVLPISVTKKAGLPIPQNKTVPEIEMKALKGAEFVSLFENQLVDKELKRLCDLEGVDINIIARCVNIETMYSLAVNGVGGALVPEAVIDSRKKDIRIYRVKNSTKRKIYAVMSKSAFHSEPMLDLIEIMKNITEKDDGKGLYTNSCGVFR